MCHLKRIVVGLHIFLLNFCMFHILVHLGLAWYRYWLIQYLSKLSPTTARILRALRIAARLGLHFSRDTAAAMCNLSSSIVKLEKVTRSCFWTSIGSSTCTTVPIYLAPFPSDFDEHSHSFSSQGWWWKWTLCWHMVLPSPLSVCFIDSGFSISCFRFM